MDPLSSLTDVLIVVPTTSTGDKTSMISVLPSMVTGDPFRLLIHPLMPAICVVDTLAPTMLVSMVTGDTSCLVFGSPMSGYYAVQSADWI